MTSCIVNDNKNYQKNGPLITDEILKQCGVARIRNKYLMVLQVWKNTIVSYGEKELFLYCSNIRKFQAFKNLHLTRTGLGTGKR